MGTDQSSDPPAPGRLVRPRTQKFRASCDACSSSKVKCDQRRPSCRRCSDLRRKCHYSPSRRMGKPAAVLRSPGKAQGIGSSIPMTKLLPEAQGPRYSHTPAEAILPCQNLSALEVNMPELEDPMSASWEEGLSNPLGWSNHTVNAALTAIDTLNKDHDLVSHSTTLPFVPFGSNDPELEFDGNCLRSISTSLGRISNNGPRGSADVLSLPISNSECSNPRCDCTILVSSTLQNLDVDCHIWDASSPTKNDYSTLTVDSILINNKAAIVNAHRFLACPCSLNPGFSLAITLICYQIIERYEAIIGATPRPSSPSTMAIASLLPTRITVGEYQIDAEDEQNMRIQLVLYELRKVRELVRRYGERYCTGLDGHQERHEGIYSALEMFLQSKLSETVNCMVHTLQN